MILLARHDMGKALGLAVAPHAGGRPVIALDGVAAQEDDYLDLGQPLMQGRVIPVVVKTLLFG
jgi:ethanolamine utilization protein EutA